MCSSGLTITHVASHQHVAVAAGAAVAAHGVVALVVAACVPLAALVDICKQDKQSGKTASWLVLAPVHVSPPGSGRV